MNRSNYIALCLSAALLTGCKTGPMDNYTPNSPVVTTIPQTSQFDTNEAMAMIEFCVDLDSQDDRLTKGHPTVFNMRQDRCPGWKKMIDSRDLFAKSRNLDETSGNNPARNGFPPFDSAWTLWKNTESNQPVYALAFRGTVVSSRPSAAEDALATTVASRYGIEYPPHKYLPVTFAVLPRAEVHEGFAYAAFSQLFDGQFGVLKNIHDVVEPGSTLIITGHSQGAALATLTHAFFYYAAKEGRFQVAEMNFKPKSYVFAQPKPGNVQFALDFAHITGCGSNAFVFNNTLDPVPALPPTHLFAADAFQDVRGRGFGLYVRINNAMNRIKRCFSGLVSDTLASKIKQVTKANHDSFYLSKELREGSATNTAGGVSQSYTLAGNVIPLRGFSDGTNYYGIPKDGVDPFIQHHATTYRRLLERSYGYEATNEHNIQ
jgi:hypothetical protein